MFEPEIPMTILRRSDPERAAFADLFEEETARIQIRDRMGDLGVETVREAGCGLRVVDGSLSRYRYCEGFDEAALLDPGSRTVLPATPVRHDFTGELPLLLGIVKSAVRSGASRDTRLRDLAVTFAALKKSVRIHNTDGVWVSSDSIRAELSVRGSLAANGKSGVGVASLAGTDLAAFSKSEARDLAARAVEAAAVKLETPRFRDGVMDVVFSGQATGVLVHEILGHQMEADALSGESESLAMLVGRRIAPRCLTMIDDPSLPGLWGSYAYDDEGTRAVPAVLIEKGILVGFLTDRASRQSGLRGSMGSARRESFRHPPIPRMSNTYLAPGDADPADILRSTRRGILVHRMRAGSLNPLSGHFVLYVGDGSVIENGRILHPVSDLMILGNRDEALSAIDRIGNDLNFAREAAWCRKKGQTVPISQGGPTLRISGLFVLSKREPEHET